MYSVSFDSTDRTSSRSRINRAASVWEFEHITQAFELVETKVESECFMFLADRVML